MGVARHLEVIRRNRRRHHPVANVSAGRAAELQMAAVLDARLRHSAFEYAAGLRVPHRKGRREIDFVITTPDEIWAVELKNWSGFVRLDGSHVVQHRAGGRGVVDHGNLLSSLRHKERVLRNYLKRHVDEVPPIWTVLVFANDRVGIAEELVGRDDLDVVRIREFLGALPAAPAQYGPIWSALRRLFGAGDDREPKKALPAVSEPIRQTRQALATLGTWDLVMLHGGRILSGDVVGLSVEELFDRQRFRRLELNVPRSYLDALGSKLALEVRGVQRDGEECDFELGFEETLTFHRAGQPKPEDFALRDAVGVSYGYVSKTD